MALFFSSCWFVLTNCCFYVIRLLNRYFFRQHQIENSSQKDDSNYSPLPEKSDETVPPSNVARSSHFVPEVIEFKDSEYGGFEEEPSTPSFSFKFQFQSSEDIRRSVEESEATTEMESRQMKMTNLSRHCLQYEKDFAGFIEEPEIARLGVREPCVATTDDNFSSRKEMSDAEYEGRAVSNKKWEAEIFRKDNVAAIEMFINSKINSSDTNDLLSERDYCGYDSDPESITISEGLSLKNQTLDSNSDGFLFETDFCDLQHEAVTTNYKRTKMLMVFVGEKEDSREGIQKIFETQLQDSYYSGLESNSLSNGFSFVDDRDYVYNLSLSDTDSIDFSEVSSVMNQFNANDSALSNEFLSENDFNREDGQSVAELWESEDTQFPFTGVSDIESFETCQTDGSSSTLSNKFLSENEFGEKRQELESFSTKETEQDVVNDSKELESGTNNPLTSDSDSMSGLESLWEHQDLIDQLRTELRKVRAIGLPTILEQSESPKTMEDLKSWRIDENFLHEDSIDELHKLYKSYRERMRKFDILNYQKMFAVGLLQLEDPLELLGCHKSSISTTITSLLSQNLRLNGRLKTDTDPSKKFIKELQSDLESVYVGQACLSWEFLHWQYEKSREMQESDPEGSQQYNQVAGEFQQFQVLVQRFLENEPFQGPRVQNYVKCRCVQRNLLQVPAIKDDCLSEKEEERSGSGNDAITTEMLTEIMEKSVRIFWDFIKADRNETNAILKGLLGTETELQDPTDTELLLDIRADLQKKEKKVKDLLRTGYCLVKRFQKPQEEKFDQLIFFAQVDMKLVSRVLKMSRITTDQLVWCQKKLDKITFQDRRIHREPSFLLFPC